MPVICGAVEILVFLTVFDAVILVFVKEVGPGKRPSRANASQHEVAGPAGAEVQIARFVQEDVGATGHSIVALKPIPSFTTVRLTEMLIDISV